jgi:hypothetical protein
VIRSNGLSRRHLLPRDGASFENVLQLLPSISIKPADINHADIAMNTFRTDLDPKLITEDAKDPNIGSILRDIEAQVPFDILSKLPTKFKLDTSNRKILFEDVKTFWENTDLDTYKNTFKHGI